MNQTYADLKQQFLKNATEEEKEYINILDEFLALSMTQKDLKWIQYLSKLIDGMF